MEKDILKEIETADLIDIEKASISMMNNEDLQSYKRRVTHSFMDAEIKNTLLEMVSRREESL